jgi:HMG-box domain
MKEFVRLGAQKWVQMREEEKERYRQMSDIDKMRYER